MEPSKEATGTDGFYTPPSTGSESSNNQLNSMTGEQKIAMPAVEDMSSMDPSGLKRDLQLRHMVMIAISGTIGTGLFLTSGKTIATAGPLGARK